MKKIIIISVVVLIALLIPTAIIVNHYKQKAIVSAAISQHNKEEYEANIYTLELERKGVEALIDSITIRALELKKELSKSVTREKAINYKLQAELNRNKLLPNDDAVALFLDRSDCGEIPIMQRDSLYLIPIEPIRVYNDIRDGYDNMVDLNAELKSREIAYQNSISNCENNLVQKDKQVKNVEEIIEQKDLIITEDQNIINQDKKKLRQQKVKTWIAGIGGVGIGALALIVVMAL